VPNNRLDISTRLIVDGRPLVVTYIQNPTIEDVMSTEAKIQAAAIANQDGSADNRVVDRDIRDFLIRLGVER
jgi:hypothetical protein